MIPRTWLRCAVPALLCTWEKRSVKRLRGVETRDKNGIRMSRGVCCSTAESTKNIDGELERWRSLGRTTAKVRVGKKTAGEVASLKTKSFKEARHARQG